VATTSVLDTPALESALEQSPDAVVARAVLERVVDAHPDVIALLETNAVLRDGLIAIGCASRSLTTAVVADASLLEALQGDAVSSEREVESYAESLATMPSEEDPARRLRYWKRREYLRIAVRDLLGIADMPAVGRELAALAEVCLGEALHIAAPTAPFAIIGMGKLGGVELNYASDVDVLFVHDGALTEAERVARSVLSTMSTPTADGLVFRTDADLRPEGAAGAISRNLESYETWYSRWARPWEFQALIKARVVAGDRELGDRHLQMAQPFVWPDVLDPDAVREARAMKARSEAELRRKGIDERELKRGPGGIRDIEFAVQLLQRVHGRHDGAIRSATTLDALRQLAAAGYIEPADAHRLSDAYVYLRTVEHRLQLWDEQQTHTLPTDDTSRQRLARVLGYRDSPRQSAVELFEVDHRTHQTTVRSIHERLFFAPILDALAGAGPLPSEAAVERLAAFGFGDAAHTRAALRDLTQGLTRRSRVMQQLLPVVLDWLSESPDPDLGLLQLRRLAEGPTQARALALTFREHPGAAERVCRIIGSSRLIGDALLRQPEVVELLGDDDWLGRPRDPDELTGTALETLGWRADAEARRSGLRRFKRRELLRIASRDLVGLSPIETAARELADLADACVQASLQALEPALPFAVMGMGRLGGSELSYASDIDVLFVYDGSSSDDFATAEAIATALMAEIGATTAEGQAFRIDANLRPEGKHGVLARSLDGFRQYYEQWVLPWELQSLLRARPVAGDMDLAARFIDLVEPFVYRDPFPEDDAREVRRIKARVERERIPPGEDPEFHLKLGKGALTDVEFTVQLLQLQHGATRPEIRAASTMQALDRLGAAAILDAGDVQVLSEAYRFCERARNARYLVVGTPGDALPTGPPAARIARLLGYTHRPEMELREEYRRLTRQARRVVERVFYGNDE